MLLSEMKTQTPPPPSYLVTDVQSEDDGQHAGGRIATVTLGPTIVSILKERRVHHQNLQTHTHTHGNMFNVLVFINSL